MRKRICGMLMLAAVAGSALSAAGQVTASRSRAVSPAHQVQAPRLPYTAEYKISTVKTLSNGATITHESTEVRAVDSEGRVVTSRTSIPASGDQPERTHVTVTDPVARTSTIWESPGQTATVTAMAAPGTQTACPPIAPQHPAVQPAKPVIEDLGTETIAGVEARGRRTTTTVPVGTIGNDTPLIHTVEMWTAIAPGLRGLQAREIVDSPQSGKM